MDDERKFKSLKREVQRDLRTAYWEYVTDIVTLQDSDSNGFTNIKRFWKFIKHQTTDFHEVSPLKVDERLVTDPQFKAEALNLQFQSVFTHETLPDIHNPQTQIPLMLDIAITGAGVLKLLKNLNPSKASGPDNLSLMLKELSVVLADPLPQLFRKSLASGHIPNDWKQTNVAPVFNKGKNICAPTITVKLVGKRIVVVGFLLVITEHFSLSVTDEALRAKID